MANARAEAAVCTGTLRHDGSTALLFHPGPTSSLGNLVPALKQPSVRL